MTNARARSQVISCTHPSLSALPPGVTVALGLLIAGAALAQQEPADPSVACRVSGYDVIIRNTGTEPIASGVSVDWSVPFARMEGSHVLTAVLDPGARVFLNGALGSNFLSSSAECVVGLTGKPEQPTGGDDAPAPSAY